MRCPQCHKKTRVVDVRPVGLNTRRIRSCRACGYTFGTIELLRDRISGSKSAPVTPTQNELFSIFGWRQRMGMSVAAAARALGVSPGVIRGMEAGRTEVSIRTALACQYLEGSTLCSKAS